MTASSGGKKKFKEMKSHVSDAFMAVQHVTCPAAEEGLEILQYVVAALDLAWSLTALRVLPSSKTNTAFWNKVSIQVVKGQYSPLIDKYPGKNTYTQI